MEKQIAIFGAGFYGKQAFEQCEPDQVFCFLDNNPEKQGKVFCGKRVFPPEQIAAEKDNYHILIASLYSESIIAQLKELGITDYSVYVNELHGFYESNELVVNPYETTAEVSTEAEWSGSDRMAYMRKSVNDEVEALHDEVPLFNHIEIETINRCNGSCAFCPVNHRDDPREKAVMTREMFENIVTQLEEIQYSGRFTTFSNNEPLLDERIIEFNQYARKHLPNARMHLYTNGTLMTLDKFRALVEVLDELIIDNYQQELKLIKPCLEIQEYCKAHPELTAKVTIVLRKPQEILTSRGGTAPNRKELVEYATDRCVLPYKQMIIRPTGQVSLCCNDAIGKFTLGDLNKERLLDIWYGPRFEMVRKCLYEGRENWGNCKYCDTFYVG
jgi:organic radical activating enzyme/L-rhamnose mutarotase